MSNIFENLPNGSSRNKIEYLARHLDELIATASNHTCEAMALLQPKTLWKIGGEYNSSIFPMNGNLSLPAIPTGGTIEYDIIFKPEDLPYLFTTADHQRQIMYGIGSDIEFRIGLSVSGLPTSPSDYWIIFPTNRFDVFIDGEPVESHTEIGRLFDGKSHNIRYVIKSGTGEAPQIGAHFNGIIHNVKAFDSLGTQLWDLPMNEGSGSTFTCQLTNVIYQRREGQFQPQGTSGQWVKVKPCAFIC